MNDSILPIIEKIIKEHGLLILSNALLFENLLKDLAPGEKAQTHLLVNSIKEDIPNRILKMKELMQDSSVIDQLGQELSKTYLIQKDAAEWVIEVWLKLLKKTIGPPFERNSKELTSNHKLITSINTRLKQERKKKNLAERITKDFEDNQTLCLNESVYELYNKNIIIILEQKIYCFDNQLDKLIWKLAPKGRIIKKIQISNNSIIALTDSYIYKIQNDDGKVLIEKELNVLVNTDYQSSHGNNKKPIQKNKTEYSISNHNELIKGKNSVVIYNESCIDAFDYNTGKRTMIKSFDDNLINVFYLKSKIYTVTNNYLSCYCEKDYELLWTYPLKSKLLNLPLISDYFIILHQLNSKSGSTINFIDNKSGVEGDKYSFKTSLVSSLFLTNRYLFIPVGSDLYIFNLSNKNLIKVSSNNILPNVKIIFISQYMFGSNNYIIVFTENNEIFYYDFDEKIFVDYCDDFLFNETKINPLISDNEIIISTNNQKLVCFRLTPSDNIIIRWSKVLRSQLIFEIECFKETIVFVTEDNYVHVCNTLTGSILWEKQFFHLLSKPVINYPSLYLRISQGQDPNFTEKLICVDLINGKTLWESMVSFND